MLSCGIQQQKRLGHTPVGHCAWYIRLNTRSQPQPHSAHIVVEVTRRLAAPARRDTYRTKTGVKTSLIGVLSSVLGITQGIHGESGFWDSERFRCTAYCDDLCWTVPPNILGRQQRGSGLWYSSHESVRVVAPQLM